MRTIPTQETLNIEFKSDRKRLSDRDLIAAIVCLTNTEGGTLYLGVEDNGTITGLNPQRQSAPALSALITNRTNPPVSVRIHLFQEDGYTIAAIDVPKSQRLTATSEGLLQRRRLKADGTPECVPFYPYEFTSRQSSLGFLDHSFQPIIGATPADFDPLERERLRQLIERFNGDTSLMGLADSDLDGALGLVRTIDGERIPTVTGLLLIGREAAIRNHLPTHEVAFQVLDGTQVRVNDFYRTPLLKTFERVMEQFEARIEEDEVQWGLFRIPVPTYDRRAFREALVNALVHRDYAVLGQVYVRLQNNTLSISNPGGFIEGVTLNNLLIVEPKPRNPALADAIKRIGLAERTGRGVDLIFQGFLRYGRPEPDYSRSDTSTVQVLLQSTEADIPFLKMIVEEETRTQIPISVEALIILSRLRNERRLDVTTGAIAIQRTEATTRSILERLVEKGLIEARGIKKGRIYTLSAEIYRDMGQSADYVRQVGFNRIQQEQMVIQYTQEHGQITRKDVMDLCRLSEYQAGNLLRRLKDAGQLTLHGKSRGAYYTISENE